ncbi:MAG TPA: cytochrome c1 [Gammaproteobacteria bacterium]|jgi:ubiquinol-cytochrome c reductase cytochrome c1 subunit|nr:cytochrome c1 [Gammaproteobacteria bacterium]
MKASEGNTGDNFLVANNDVSDVNSLQRGAGNFFNYCAGCHSLKFIRYNQIAEDLDLNESQLVQNLIFTQAKPEDAVITNMLPSDGSRWFGKSPPDLSLITRSRGTDQVYNFLRTFYKDSTSPTGADNRALPGTSMPNVLWLVQEQLNEKEFDQFTLDIVNFLDYVSEPIQSERKRIGIWVILFLLVFLVFSYGLYKDIWKEVH